MSPDFCNLGVGRYVDGIGSDVIDCDVELH